MTRTEQSQAPQAAPEPEGIRPRSGTLRSRFARRSTLRDPQHSHKFALATGYFRPLSCAVCGKYVWSGVVGTSHPAYKCPCGMVIHGHCSEEIEQQNDDGGHAHAAAPSAEASPSPQPTTTGSDSGDVPAMTPPPIPPAQTSSPPPPPGPVQDLPPADISLESWLWVRRGAKWDRGFVVLRRQVLAWLDLTKRGSLSLGRVRGVDASAPNSATGYPIGIELEGGSVFHASALSLSGQSAWESAFRAVVAANAADADTPATAAAAASASAAGAERALSKVRFVGCLRIPAAAETPLEAERKKRRPDKWAPRCVMLQGGTMTWYAVSERVRISLEESCACCSIVVKAIGSQGLSVSSGSVSLVLQADNETAAARWLSRVRAAVSPFQGVARVDPVDDDAEEDQKPTTEVGGCARSPMRKKKRVVLSLMSLQESLNADMNAFQLASPCLPLPLPAGRKFFVLSLDGGGCRGVITQVMLARILNELPDLLDRVDLVAGTSAGGLGALALARGHSPRLVREFQEMMFREGFSDRRPMRSWGLRARFRNSYAQYLVDMLFKDTRLGHLRKRVVVPALSLDNNATYPNPRRAETRFFHNLGGPEDSSNERAADVALRTMSAPTFVPSYQGCVDGAIFANNPCAIGLIHAVSPNLLGVPAGDIVCLSLGTGQAPLSFWEGEQHDWGLVQWAVVLPTVMVDAAARTAEQMGRLLIGDRFWQVDPLLPTKIPVDDASMFPAIIDIANKVDLAPTIAFLRQQLYT
eukprot:m51a1_g14692 hypothetical protein (754) ;mRNA; f:104766-107583